MPYIMIGVLTVNCTTWLKFKEPDLGCSSVRTPEQHAGDLAFSLQHCINPLQRCMLAILALRKQRYEGQKFKVIFDYTVSLRPAWATLKHWLKSKQISQHYQMVGGFYFYYCLVIVILFLFLSFLSFLRFMLGKGCIT